MNIKLYMKKESGRSSYFAQAKYDGQKCIVLPGGHINPDFASYIRGGKVALKYRNDAEYVDKNGIILKECEFSSPSTAAQFVTGRSIDGYYAWRVEASSCKNLDEFLKEKGLR